MKKAPDRPRADAPGCPPQVGELCDRAVDYVTAALGVTLELDSDTLPVLDHYVRSAKAAGPDSQALVTMVAGIYFGEVVRRRLGGHWEAAEADPAAWRVILPGGLELSPMAAAASALSEEDEAPVLTGPPKILAAAEEVLARMGEVSVETYYSLSGRFDTLEHVHETLVAIAAARAAEQN